MRNCDFRGTLLAASLKRRFPVKTAGETPALQSKSRPRPASADYNRQFRDIIPSV
jgi:hypothetical protein